MIITNIEHLKNQNVCDEKMSVTYGMKTVRTFLPFIPFSPSLPSTPCQPMSPCGPINPGAPLGPGFPENSKNSFIGSFITLFVTSKK